MEIVSFQPNMAAELARCYNDFVAGVPYCAPVAAEAFADAGRLAVAHTRDERMVVAREHGGRIVGFAHTAVAAPPTEDWHPKGEPGLIRFLAYLPGRRAAGAALLDSAERRFREHDRREIWAWSNDYAYAFYHLPFAHLSEGLGHVHALLGQAGYRMQWSELLFDWPDFEAPAAPRPDLPFELRVAPLADVSIGPKVMVSGAAVRAMQDGRKIGLCEMGRLGPDSLLQDVHDWCFCRELHVEEAMQGRGLGKFLLAAGLEEMRKRGCRHTAISTDWDNYRAQLFYTNFGFRLVDRTFAFAKGVGLEHGAAQG